MGFSAPLPLYIIYLGSCLRTVVHKQYPSRQGRDKKKVKSIPILSAFFFLCVSPIPFLVSFFVLAWRHTTTPT